MNKFKIISQLSVYFTLQIGGNVARFSVTGSAKKKANNNSEELIQKIWGSVRSNNGIMVYIDKYVYIFYLSKC